MSDHGSMACPICGKEVRITRVNELRVHLQPKAKGGGGGGRCPASGNWVHALPKAVRLRQWEKEGAP